MEAAMASILMHGALTHGFQWQRAQRQGDLLYCIHYILMYACMHHLLGVFHDMQVPVSAG
jgi:hypothetical protein